MWIDAVLTLTLSPLAFVALLAVSIVALAAPLATALPIVFAALGIIIADIVTRDTRAGTTASLYAVPRLRESYAWWKFGSTLLLSFIFCVVPLMKSAVIDHHRLASLAIGILFVSAAATLLGLVSRNAKTFIVLFLSFWYVVTNDKGATPLLDFGGFFGNATSQTLGTYATLTIVCIFGAHIAHKTRLARA
jgi:hypothetical protein